MSLQVCAMQGDRSGRTFRGYDVLGLVKKEDVIEDSMEKQVFLVNVLVKDPALPGERFEGRLLEVENVRPELEAGRLVATHCFYVNENLLPVFWDLLVTKSWGAELRALETLTDSLLQICNFGASCQKTPMACCEQSRSGYTWIQICSDGTTSQRRG